MNDEKIKRLEAMSGIGKNVRFKKKEGGGYTHMGIIEDEVYIMVGDYKHLLQKIKFNPEISWDGSVYAFRTGYYTYDKDRNHIKWGQFSQCLTEKEYRVLLKKAIDKGWKVLS